LRPHKPKLPKNQGAIPGKTGSKGKPVLDDKPKLKDLGVTKTQVTVQDSMPSHSGQRRNAMATCPICKSDAEEVKSGFIDGKTFRCAKHGEFQVSDSVLSVPALVDADATQWEAALKNAAWRADPGVRPRILSYDF
jgi:hypothetical protein